MSDLVQRLRSYRAGDFVTHTDGVEFVGVPICLEAADEIERLQSRSKQTRHFMDRYRNLAIAYGAIDLIMEIDLDRVSAIDGDSE